MDTQTFLDNLKSYVDRFTESSQIPSDFFAFFESNYETYTSATPKERDDIRAFVSSPSKPKSLFGSLFRSNKETSQIAHMLLVYVKERVLPQLKSTKDATWLYRGLAAISMDDFAGAFDDQAYTAYPMKGDALFLLADLFVTAEEAGINPDPIFIEIADISSSKIKKYSPMKDSITNAGKNKFAHERRQHGKFVGMF
jgi:hypothetical protein